VLPNSKKILAVSSKAQVSLSSIKEVEPLLSCIIIHLGVDSYSISCSIHDITLFTLRCQTKYCTYACLPILSVYELLRYQRKHIIRNNNDYHCGYEQLATATVPQFFKKLKPLLNYCHHSRSLIEKRYGSSSCHTLRSKRFVLLLLLLGDSWS
jgi:hypothetical protein